MKTNHLPNVLWIGGSPCSGKSSVAEQLAEIYNLNLYRVDDHYGEHIEQINPVRQPTMALLTQMSWDDLWMRPVELQVETALAFYGEIFEIILADLKKIKPKSGIIVEGVALLPSNLAKISIPTENAFFMVPTSEFQLEHYSKRPWIQDILAETSDPKQAFANWMARDVRFGELVVEEAAACGYTSMVVDGSASLEENIAEVSSHFGLK
jgi:uridine kinase